MSPSSSEIKLTASIILISRKALFADTGDGNNEAQAQSQFEA